MDAIPNDVWYALAALAGGMVSLAHLQKLDLWKRVGAVIVGTLTAIFVAPVVGEYFAFSNKMTACIHFLIGLGGLMISGGIFALFRGFREKPLEKIAELLTLIAKGKKNGG
jgi:hypothetical protein